MSMGPSNALDEYGRTLLGRFDARWLSRREARIVLIALAAVALITPSIQFIDKLFEVTESPFRGEMARSALGRWLEDAAALSAGEDPYGPGHWFPNPPLVLLVLVPLTHLPLVVTGLIWAVVKVAATVGGIQLMAKSICVGGRTVAPLGVLVAACAFSFRPIVQDIQHGNINLIVLVELAAAWYAFVRGRSLSAGLLIGLAITTKVTPALLLPYFALKREWRVVIGGCVGLLVFGLLLPDLVLGFGRTMALSRTWFDMLIAPHLLHGYITSDFINQSMPGVLMRWMAAAGWITLEHLGVQHSLAFGMEDMARPVEWVGRAVLTAGGLMLLGATTWLCRRRVADRRDPRLGLEFALMLLTMLLLSERTWKHHLVTIVLVYLVVWSVLACEPWSKAFRAGFVGGLAAQWLLLTASSEGVVGEELADDLLDRGVIFVGLALCYIQTAVLLVCVTWRASKTRGP